MFVHVIILSSLVQVFVNANSKQCTVNVDKDYVLDKIKYSCRVVPQSDTPIFVPIACQVSSTLILLPIKSIGTDGTFNYECRKSTPLTMELIVTGCKRPDKVTNMYIGETFESLYNGVYRCVRSEDDSVIYKHIPVCVRPNHKYRNVSEEWVEHGVQLKCLFQHNEYHAKATGCVFFSSTGVETKAKINETVKISENNFQKCIASSSDETRASFIHLVGTMCVDGTKTYDLLTTWGSGDIAFNCVEVEMKPLKIEYGCWIRNSFALAYGSSVKLNGIMWYYCDRVQKKGILIQNANCDNIPLHELGKSWIDDDKKFMCIYSSAVGGVTKSATDCIVDTTTMVPRDKIVQLKDEDGVKYGYKCEIVSSTDLFGRRLNATVDEEYEQWKLENGIEDEDNAAYGGKGTANPKRTSHLPTTSLAPQTTHSMTKLPTSKPTTQPTKSKPTTQNPTSKKANATCLPLPPATVKPKPDCKDKADYCRLLAHICNEKKHGSKNDDCDSEEDDKRSEKSNWLAKLLGITKHNGGIHQEKLENKNKSKNNKSHGNNEHGKHHGKTSHENNNKGKNKGKHSSSEESKKNKHGHNEDSEEEHGNHWVHGHGGTNHAQWYIKFVQQNCPKTCNICGKST